MPKGKYDPYKDVTWTRTPQPGDEILQSLPGRRGYGYKGPGAGEKISPGASPIAVQYATPPPGGINMVIPDQYTQRTASPKSVPPGVQRFKEKENRRQVPVTAPKAKDPRRADKKREQRKQDVKKIMPDIYQGGRISPDSPILNKPLDDPYFSQPKISSGSRRTTKDWKPNVRGGFQTSPVIPTEKLQEKIRKSDPKKVLQGVLETVATAPLYGGAGRLLGPVIEKVPVVGRTLGELNRSLIAGTTGRPVAPVKGMGPKIPTRGPRLTDPPVGPQKPMQWRKKPDPSLTPLERSLPPTRSSKGGNVPDPRMGREGRLTSPKIARESADIEYRKDVINRNRVLPNRRPGDLNRKLDLLTETSAKPIAQVRNEQIRLARANSFNPKAATDELILLEAKAGVPEAIAELRRRGIIAGRRASSSASPPPPRMDLKDLPF